jgi:hypothetical protein
MRNIAPPWIRGISAEGPKPANTAHCGGHADSRGWRAGACSRALDRAARHDPRDRRICDAATAGSVSPHGQLPCWHTHREGVGQFWTGAKVARPLDSSVHGCRRLRWLD